MRKLFLVFCTLFFSFCYAQKENGYVFNVELSNYEYAPTFKNSNGILRYVGENKKEQQFFSKYTITNFYQTYPSSKVLQLLNMYTFETADKDMMNDILKAFPEKYLRIENLTGEKMELLTSYYPSYYPSYSSLYYPNDYGANGISMKSFDYINAPKAWDYFTPGDIGNVAIGISDGEVNNTDADLSGKTSYLHYSGFNHTFICPACNVCPGFYAWHGTNTAATAAAQGNNGHGMTGVCPDCTIISTPNTFNYLLDLANAGVDVINMSWVTNYFTSGIIPGTIEPTYIPGFVLSQQLMMNELHDMGVILVAGAGNVSPYNNDIHLPYPWIYYCYPASYDHVISVTSVQAKNDDFTDEVTNVDGVDVSWYNEDLITPTGTYIGGVYSPYNEGTTTNTRVDICGPGYAPQFSNFLLGCPPITPEGAHRDYVSSTSAAAPYVAGTAALMRSLNPCLINDEAEDVLQLCAKNIEANPYNAMFIGRLGAGKLETGDAVEFTHEMMTSSTGNAVVDGQDFWRFDFNLKHILNGLTISNQTFRDHNTTNFTAKNFIDVIQNTDLRPGSDGFVDLNIDTNLVVCDPSKARNRNAVKSEKPKVISKIAQLYPNPNKGTFTIKLSQKGVRDLSIKVFDIMGKQVYEAKSEENTFEVSIPNLPSGMYLVELSSDNIHETLKFIKE